ncbi:MAG TPA: hypothetical protein VGC23_06870, partial [Vicinamibacterales bacterium]
DASTRDQDPFREQQGAFREQVPAVASEFAASRYDAMTGDGRVGRCAHDVANSAMGPRPSGCSRYVAIGRDSPVRNTSDDMAYSRGKI